ncbi:putative 5-formyltetrahydrofolate cyclo-ligase-like [Tropilaelaps mercedesae]|uniref:5-formyltetrahydrofolate cyclo-ligase n=1 Tax=Tropilaelaps mercedesae TaxID=418985 RepID=A0A1V9XHW7_9ACAR|nr:putative 5-formyltetrahydrofolate cyclo-ligase-like [Tropilaelaps mercedesae]
MEMVQVPSELDFDSMPLTKWNIPQPAMAAPWIEAIEAGGLDLILCPGIAFTTEGYRLGRGMGYYDRYLQKLKAHCPDKKMTLVGLALSVQIVPDGELPRGPNDVKLDHILQA